MWQPWLVLNYSTTNQNNYQNFITLNHPFKNKHLTSDHLNNNWACFTTENCFGGKSIIKNHNLTIPSNYQQYLKIIKSNIT